MTPFRFLRLKLLLPVFLAVMAFSVSVRAGEITLQDPKMLVSFDEETGAITRMVSKAENWTIERRAGLGISFRMLVPLPDRQDNFVLGPDQHAAQVKKISDHEVVIVWDHLRSQHGGPLPVTFTADVRLEDGVLTFGGKIVNRSGLMIETVDYPYLGDLNPPSTHDALRVRTMWYDDLQSQEIYPHFGNSMGYWGVNYPTKTFDSYRSLFCLIQSGAKGMYVEMKNPDQPYLIQYTFEQHPGVLSTVSNRVPVSDSLSGHPVHLEFRTCHFIYAHAHDTATLAPVVLQCYHGDWHAGVDLYKKWRATWYRPAYIPEWVKDVHSWQQLQINSPVQDYRVPYEKLIEYGRECAENGVAAIQLVGWNDGGQDGGDPSLSVDPHLGTAAQLREAIAKIQAMGVHMILFGKLNWADMTTPWYKQELYKYEAKDPYGIPYYQDGYSYYTPVQLATINNHRRAIMDFSDPGYRALAAGQFRKLLSLGASGWLFDEVCHHGIVKYNFATGHGYTPPGFIYAGDMPMAKELRKVADSVSRDFIFAGEGPQDWLTQCYPFTYTRVSAGSTPVQRYIDPRAPILVAVSGFNDREMLNLCLLDRYSIEYEPYNFKGHLTDFPLTLAYGKQIDSLRRKYRDYVWDADFQDTQGATVSANGAYKYAVFAGDNGEKAAVIINMESGKAITAHVAFPQSGPLRAATPEHPDAQPTSGTLTIPPLSAVVVMKK